MIAYKTYFKKKVVITGSEGQIGSILKSGLGKDFELYLIDKRAKKKKNNYRLDISKEYKKLKSVIKSKDAIIHLAWDNFEDFPNDRIVSDNKLMAENVYRAASEVKLRRIIIASSVHANDCCIKQGKLISALDNPCPDTPYGASKIYIESLGKYYAKHHGLQVICIRFGGINPGNKVMYKEDPNYDKVLLYKEDCINLIRKCINTKKVPSNFAVFYAISNNANRIHSVKNFLNWKPIYPLDNS